MKRNFYVKAVWDDEAKVFYADSDIKGLGIEAADLDTFEEVMNAHAIELIMANHVTAKEAMTIPVCDLVPTIIYHKPHQILSAA